MIASSDGTSAFTGMWYSPRLAPDHSAAQLALHHARVDDPPGGENADEPRDPHLSKIGIDFDFGKHGAVGMHGVRLARHCIGRALSLRVDLRKTSAAEDIGVALAAALIVTAVQAAAARDHAGIAGAEQRRAMVAGRKLG